MQAKRLEIQDVMGLDVGLLAQGGVGQLPHGGVLLGAERVLGQRGSSLQRGLQAISGVFAAVLTLHGIEHPRRWQPLGLAQVLACLLPGLLVGLSALRGVEGLCHHQAFTHDLVCPLPSQHVLRATHQLQLWVAALGGHLALVLRKLAHLGWTVHWTVAEHGPQQKGIQHTHGVGIDAHIQIGLQVHAAHLDILHAAIAQGMQGTLAPARDALGTNG